MNKTKQDKIRGALLGGAAGDALGYPVEFMSLAQIKDKYGENGITDYTLSNGTALISDDTQLTLFTADGLLVSDTMGKIPGNRVLPEMFVPLAYRDWLKTQNYSFANAPKPGTPEGRSGISWLLDVPELYARRAPGITCLSAIQKLDNAEKSDFFADPVNNSKDCGGIMRIAPVGLRYAGNIREIDLLAAKLSAVTHGHSLGYMPSAVLTHIFNRLVYSIAGLTSLKAIITEAKETARELFADDENIGILCELIDKAVLLSENDQNDKKNIPLLGEGWVAEETLAIALYCALKYEHDFSAGITAAVNHSGDSDSTGSLTGQIIGAAEGFEAIDKKWSADLELKDIILEIADDLAADNEKSPDGEVFPPDIECKYLRMRRKEYMDMLQFG